MLCDVPVQTYYEYVQPYRDSFGLIAQGEGDGRDGGDSAHRTGVFYLGLYLLFKDNKVVVKQIEQDFKKDLNKITIGPGKFVRHPDPAKWYSNPENFTRDQTTPLIIALGFFDDVENRKIIRQNLQNIFDNSSFYPNRLKNWTNEEKVFPFDYNDPAGPSDYGMFVRALKKENYKPLLWFSDIQLVGDSLLRVFFSYFNNKSTSNDLNYSLILLQAQRTYPTWWSDIATYIYFNFKRRSPATVWGEGSSGVMSSWNYYFRPEANSAPLNLIYQCIIDPSFKK